MPIVNEGKMFDKAQVSPTQTRSFIAEVFSTGSGYNICALPWFFDLTHLTFWFFFLTSFVLGVWLVQTFFVLTRCGESRFPVRETRGFSRAQTGDSLTAVIPMCWSITMLMHAGVHSSNFDENTDSAAVGVTVMAYQWGWNYFFPLDIITTFSPTNCSKLAADVSNNVDSISSSLLSLNRPKLTPNSISGVVRSQSGLKVELDEKLVTQFRQFGDPLLLPSLITCKGVGEFSLEVKRSSLLTTCSKMRALCGFRRPQAGVFIPTHILPLSNSSYAPAYPALQTRLNCTTTGGNFTSSLGNQALPVPANEEELTTPLTTFELPVIGTPQINPLSTLPASLSLISLPRLGEDVDTEFFSSSLTSEFGMTRSPVSLVTDLLLVGGLVNRFRITSAVLLPSDYPIHLVCGSKDVIHSWAIPGLGIKIDCIPGFNCHRRVLIRWRGLFWGQCMEVCGRYHHWMPILVKVTSLEVFILWLKSWL